VDAHVLDGKFQGSRTWLTEIVSRLPELVPDVDVVVYTADPRRAATLLGGARIEHRALPHVPAIARIAAYWPYAVRRDRLDLLLTQYFAPFLQPERQIVVVHDVLFETHPEFFPPRQRLRNRALVRLSARRSRKVVTVSEYSRREIARAYRLDPADVAVVRNGVAPAPVLGDLPPPVDPDRPVLLFVGRLEPRKNLRLALDAFEAADVGDAQLVVVGRDDFEDPLTLSRLRATAGAVHLQDVDPGALAALYATAAALVYPSLGEGWGIPVVEALGAGTAVLASDATAVPEAGGAACTYFDPTAHDAPEVLARLMGAAVRGELGLDEAVRSDHLAGLTWDRSAEAFAGVVRDLLGRTPG
jgi:glycosyltransferase involved in cell wall biosynthesis